jgi:hypothetical protein
MTNIWTQSFEEVRKPFFEMDDPYTKLEEEKAKRDYDGDGKVESGAKEYRGAVHNAIQRKKGGKPDGQDTSSVKEESLVEIENKVSKGADKKVDVMKGKNTVTINPQLGMKEEVEAWVSELVEEGYDLSEFTWDEMTEIYESAELNEGTAEMPARGDAETMNVTDTQMASAKRRAAQAQIRADMARVQLQKASMTRESFDSILEYLSNRPDAFENLDEAVFDPKKSKMRPASQRSQRTMTPAQRTAQKKEAERTAAIHSKGETVLAGMRSSGTRGKVQTTPTPKPAAPASNRKVKGRYDKLAAAASKVLKDINR